MKTFKGGTAVITGAASGFGLETSRIVAARGMNVVMADVQQDALDKAAAEIAATGVQVLAKRVDVSKADQVDALAAETKERFGAPNFVFNNAGVGFGGLTWESSVKDWEWVLGVNLMGVIYGVHAFTPMMLAAEKADPAYEGHIVNTASMAGMLNAPNMAVYNVSKHAVVSLSETLYQDLRLVSDRVSASVLCPYFVPTGIHEADRNRPADLANDAKPTRSQILNREASRKAVTSGKLTAAMMAERVVDAVERDQFYIYSHPHALQGVQTRMEDLLQARNPSDPFGGSDRSQQLRDALRAAD